MWVIEGVAALVVAFIIASLLFPSTRSKPDPREPPILQPTIPYIGHIIGLMLHGSVYYQMVSARSKHPIVCLPMLNSRIYIVTSAHLASYIQRASSTLQFKPLIIEVTGRIVGLSDAVKTAFYDRSAKQEGRQEFMDRMHDIIYSRLGSSEMKTAATTFLQQLTNNLNAMPLQLDTGLYHWAQHQLGEITAHAFLGPTNPFTKNPSLVTDFWTWESDVVKCLAAPQLARAACAARERVVKAYTAFLKNDGIQETDKLFQDRYRITQEAGIDLDGIARSDFGLLFGALGNSAPTMFWLLVNIFSRPDLLEELRHEIQENAVKETIDNGRKTLTIVFENIKTKCHLLNSCFRETIRLTGPMTSARQVMEDTLVAGEYLLRANSVVQVAGAVLHYDTATWGPDASSFNPRRFLTSLNGTKTGTSTSAGKESTNVHPAAFRGFGGGTVFCPGRHFAQMEILTFVAVLVLGFDFVPPKDRRSVDYNPPSSVKRIPVGVLKPLRDVEVGIRRRDGFEEVQWVTALV